MNVKFQDILWKVIGQGRRLDVQINVLYSATKMTSLKALSRGAIFLATCNAILLLVDVKLANTRFHHSLLIYS